MRLPNYTREVIRKAWTAYMRSTSPVKIIIITSSYVLAIIIIKVFLSYMNKKNVSAVSEEKPIYTINENIVFEYGEELDGDTLLNYVISYNASKIDIRISEVEIDTDINLLFLMNKIDKFEMKNPDDRSEKIQNILNSNDYSKTAKRFLILKEQGFDFEDFGLNGSITVLINGEEEVINFEYFLIDTQLPVLTIRTDGKYEYDYDEELEYQTLIKGKDNVDGDVPIVFKPNLQKGQVGNHRIFATVTDKNGIGWTGYFQVVIKEQGE